MTLRRWVTCCSLMVAAALLPRSAVAQLAPTGGHYPGRTADTAHVGQVSPAGAYQTSVPLDLPPARGGLPVPLQVTYGTRGVGAAGLGWDVPISYIWRDTTFAHRRPAASPDVAPQPREQLTLMLDGKRIDLVPTASGWVARHDAPDLVVRASRDVLLMYDGAGRTYVFDPEGPGATTLLAGGNLFLLKAIFGPDGNKLDITYRLAPITLPDGSSSLSINVASVVYNTHPDNPGCVKTEIILTYETPATTPLSFWMLGDHVFARMDKLQTIDVNSFAACFAPEQRLRRYIFNYLPDADTEQPRLSSVQVVGRQGTVEGNTVFPVASYTYGSASFNGKFVYRSAGTAHSPYNDLGITLNEQGLQPPTLHGLVYTTPLTLIDMSGDGRPDLPAGLVGVQAPELQTLLNVPGTAGRNPLVDFRAGIFPSLVLPATPHIEWRSSEEMRYNSINLINVDQIWRQAIDVNGDGRVDIIDGAERAGSWAIYLNTPIGWKRIFVSVAALTQHLREQGFLIEAEYLPLAQRSTGRERVNRRCMRWTGTNWILDRGGYDDGSCSGPQFDLGPERTITEWEVKDINGDGYPDVVFNSSRVVSNSVFDDLPPHEHGLSEPFFVVQAERQGLALSAGDASEIRAVINIAGSHIGGLIPQIYSAPVTIREHDRCSVAEWLVVDDTHQVLRCSVEDVNGDGLADRVVGRLVFMGTGVLGARGIFTLGAMLTLPGQIAVQENNIPTGCAPDQDPVVAVVFQTAGLRDLNGDNIPDYISLGPDNVWTVAPGTGVGFASSMIVDHVGVTFNLSYQFDHCDGSRSRTHEGLYDIDGDGKSDIVTTDGGRVSIGLLFRGNGIFGTPAHDAGRLVTIENGYGSKTSITYTSAKEDATSAHQVPFPEIVVSKVQTTGALGLGTELAATSYAYGDAQLVFDPAVDAFTFPGYRRSVELRIPTSEQQGMATITDTYGSTSSADPYGIVDPNDGSFIALTPKQRYDRYLRRGRLSDATVLSGSLGTDAWALLPVDINSDARRIAGTHYEWDTQFLAAATDPPSAERCLDTALPYDELGSIFYDLFNSFFDPCAAHGFGFKSSVQSWRGELGAAPPSTANVVTRSEVRGIDAFGRILSVAQLNDLYRSDDDVCIDTVYANPTGSNERVLFAPSSQTVSGCDSTIYAKEFWEYDNLAVGSVSAGFTTSHTVERRDQAGRLLGSVREFDASYDVQGNPTSIVTTREDRATRTVTIGYDPYGLAAVNVTTAGTDVVTTHVSIARDPVTLKALAITDPNGTQRGATFDGFDREVLSTITPANYTASYAENGRRLMDQVLVSSTLGSREIRYQSYDPVGRERSRTEIKDAAATGATTSFVYDALGRVSSAVQTRGVTTAFDQQFEYDPLGNIRRLANVGAASTTLTYGSIDRDRICRIRYGRDDETACNVSYDEIGNIVRQPTASGTREFSYLADGAVQTITQGSSIAHYTYDAFGAVQELKLQSNESLDTRHDRHYGGLIAWREETTGGAPQSVLTRTIPGPNGLVATRHGAGGSWVFGFGEARGNRFFTDETGAFVQDVDYRPFGEATSTGAQPGDRLYSNAQWNSGDALAAFGISHLGARIYDPAIGRFLSRDPLLIPRTATTTNAYAFAMNDPINGSDPSGLCPENGCPDIPIVPIPGIGIGDIVDGVSSIGSAIGGLFGESHPPSPPARSSQAPVNTLVRMTGDRTGGTGSKFQTPADRVSDVLGLGSFGRSVLNFADPWSYNLNFAKGVYQHDREFGVSSAKLVLAVESGTSGDVARAYMDFNSAGNEVALDSITVFEALNGLRGAASGAADALCGSGLCGSKVTCFTAGTPVVSESGLVPIEALRPGDRVHSLDEEKCIQLVENESCREIEVEMKNPYGASDKLTAHFLRTEEWVNDHDVHRGILMPIKIEELLIDGPAQVTHVGACTIQPGPGCLVTGTVTHFNPTVMRLHFEESEVTLEPTAQHHLWSSDRRGWVAANDLKVGERLVTEGGAATISSIERLEGVRQVFNLEVAGAHTYLVSELRIKSHNAEGCDLLVTKAVNTKLPHAAGRAVERGIYATEGEAAEALRSLSASITRTGRFPPGTLLDTAHADRVLVPFGNNGFAVYRVLKNGTARLKTILNAR